VPTPVLSFLRVILFSDRVYGPEPRRRNGRRIPEWYRTLSNRTSIVRQHRNLANLLSSQKPEIIDLLKEVQNAQQSGGTRAQVFVLWYIVSLIYKASPQVPQHLASTLIQLLAVFDNNRVGQLEDFGFCGLKQDLRHTLVKLFNCCMKHHMFDWINIVHLLSRMDIPWRTGQVSRVPTNTQCDLDDRFNNALSLLEESLPHLTSNKHVVDHVLVTLIKQAPSLRSLVSLCSSQANIKDSLRKEVSDAIAQLCKGQPSLYWSAVIFSSEQLWLQKMLLDCVPSAAEDKDGLLQFCDNLPESTTVDRVCAILRMLHSYPIQDGVLVVKKLHAFMEQKTRLRLYGTGNCPGGSHKGEEKVRKRQTSYDKEVKKKSRPNKIMKKANKLEKARRKLQCEQDKLVAEEIQRIDRCWDKFNLTIGAWVNSMWRKRHLPPLNLSLEVLWQLLCLERTHPYPTANVPWLWYYARKVW